MSVFFVDTSFYQALLNPRDQWHQHALEFSQKYSGPTVTGEYVLCELGALMSRPVHRALYVRFVDALVASPSTEIVPANTGDFSAGMALFSSRLDKEWSLIDCVSFSIMNARGISGALAFDHHFEQAGFQLVPERM